MSRYVVAYSSGAGSYEAARRVIAEVGPDAVTLVFTDTLIEDEDNYRFLIESAAHLYGVTLPTWWRHPWISRQRTVNRRALALIPDLVVLVDGRTPFQVFEDKRFLGNARLANCSHELKQKPFRAWLDANCDPASTTVVVGIDWSEQHRLAAPVRSYSPYAVRAPLCEEPYTDKEQILAGLREVGIKPPRLYGMGFAHANCGGGCVRAGQGQFAHLLNVMPERYADWEADEQDLRAYLGKDVAMLQDRTRAGRLSALGLTEDDVHEVSSGEPSWDDIAEEWVPPPRVLTVKATGVSVPLRVPLPLTVLRARHEAAPTQTDMFDIGGCGCFIDEEIA